VLILGDPASIRRGSAAAGLNSAEAIDVCLLCTVFVGSGLGVELIIGSVESYRVCLIVCDLNILTVRRSVLELGCCGTQREKYTHIYASIEEKSRPPKVGRRSKPSQPSANPHVQSNTI